MEEEEEKCPRTVAASLNNGACILWLRISLFFPPLQWLCTECWLGKIGPRGNSCDLLLRWLLLFVYVFTWHIGRAASRSRSWDRWTAQFPAMLRLRQSAQKPRRAVSFLALLVAATQSTCMHACMGRGNLKSTAKSAQRRRHSPRGHGCACRPTGDEAA